MGQSVCKQFIGGEWCDAAACEFFEVTNSSTGEVIAQSPLSGVPDVNAAVAAAAAAFPEWAATPVSRRAQYLFRYKVLLEEHLDDLAAVLCLEHGKTRPEAIGELRRGLEVVDMCCGMPMLMKGDTLDDLGGGVDYQTTRYPLGVCAGITPFNFPGMIPHWMFPVAIACGNTFVLKPSQQTPLTAIRFTELMIEAGFPAGVFNLVHGAKEAVDTLLVHPDVKAVSFVGSTPVAQYIYATAAVNGKRVQAAGGAKNHFVVMPDAPLELVVPNIISSAFGCAGERCMAVANVIAVGGSEKKFMPLLRAAVQKMTIGRTDQGSEPDMGPVISAEHRARIEGYIEAGVREGANLLEDGRGVTAPDAPDGFYIGPTIFDGVKPEYTIAQDEIFGPVLSVLEMDSLDAAIDHINASPFGNAACVYTRSGPDARAFRSRVNPGMVGINVGVPAPVACFPFSGWKDSFFGDLHVQGHEGILFYTQQKVVLARWLVRGALDTFGCGSGS
ncbi:MAG: CoA-acylating methylmalonate-semialdehyde dehydrogenase [Nitrospiraceae bacterium]|nr:CoA-acylating methylmalonate-semialdehyde dehydrogenase [Nitrospiraceae bacterium]